MLIYISYSWVGLMKLRNLDLNLLVALDALLEERHVTRAALRVGLSQPAMSNALTRLRVTFNDELLVRTPSGMEPTPRGMELQRPIKRVLHEIQKVLESDGDFSTTQSSRMFRLRMGDLHNVLFLPSVMSTIESTAPNVKLSVVYLKSSDTIDALIHDDIDLAISVGLDYPKTICSADFYEDRLVCVMRPGHPALKAPLTLEAYLALDHIKVAQSRADRRFIDDELARLNVVRRVPLQVQHWLVAPEIVRQTNLVSATWQKIAGRYSRNGELICLPLPFGPRKFAFKIYWHRRYDKNAAHQWLRNIVLASAKNLPVQDSDGRPARVGGRVRAS
jgi:DNA-binding transcriptional LysR family regulator